MFVVIHSPAFPTCDIPQREPVTFPSGNLCRSRRCAFEPRSHGTSEGHPPSKATLTHAVKVADRGPCAGQRLLGML